MEDNLYPVVTCEVCGRGFANRRGLATHNYLQHKRTDEQRDQAKAWHKKGGERGGAITKEKYGTNHFKTIAHDGGSAVKAKYGQKYFKNLVKKRKYRPVGGTKHEET